jgi:hypothetical protein
MAPKGLPQLSVESFAMTVCTARGHMYNLKINTVTYFPFHFLYLHVIATEKNLKSGVNDEKE